MQDMLISLLQGHDWTKLLLATVTGLMGSTVSARLFSRAMMEPSGRTLVWMFMSGIVGGVTIWTTHFIAMLGFHSDTGLGAIGYDPALTFASLGVAMAGVIAGLMITHIGGRSRVAELGGVVLGLAVVVTHYMGMESMRFSGSLVWDPAYVYASIVLGPAFGMLAANRLTRPSTRLSWCGGGVAFLLAIVMTHFTSVAGLTMEMDPLMKMQRGLLIDNGMMLVIFGVMALLITAGLGTYVIDRNTRRDAGEQVRHVALHDPLTGLPNRAFLRRTLEDRLTEARNRFGGVAVIAVDLDRFKPVNDVHGHAAGDAILVALAARVRGVLEPGEVFCRTGGDEFVALRGGVLNEAEAKRFAERLRGAMLKPVDWKGSRLSVGASMGVCLHPRDGADADTLLSRVDLALYRAKAAPGDAIQFYDARMDEASRSRSALAMELRHALDRNEFVLYMQPQNDIITRRCVGFEALIRWHHPQRGLVPPNDFIPVAEKTGLIREIGEWALREACRLAANWPDRYRIAVNVAPMQLAQPGFVEMVLDALMESGLPAERLELEVTEASLIADQVHTVGVMNNLKRAGIRIAMDDYGTGYASLAMLKAFPFDKIKIDRAFIASLDTDLQSAAIVRSTLILARALSIPVLAEGVESEAHFAFLRKEGCDEVQGFLFGRPMPIEHAERMIANAEALEGNAPGNIVSIRWPR